FMDGGDACAMVEPSRKVTIECTIDCGWTVTSTRSEGMSNRRQASISSRPLFTIVAEFNVFIWPMDQVGWLDAWSGVTGSSCSRVQPRNGPPEAVSTRVATEARRAERRHRPTGDGYATPAD